jgi:IS5 family transposase
LSLELEDRVPDSKTIWTFRNSLGKLNLVTVLFARFNAQLAEHSYASSGWADD